MDKSDDKNEKLENTATKKELNATDITDKAGGAPEKKDGGGGKNADSSLTTKQAEV